MCTNGTAVEGVCVTGAASRLWTCPGRPRKLSRWQASMAQYLQVPANVKNVICAVNCPEPEIAVENRCLKWLFITIKLSRWPAKIVTSFLTILTVLVDVAA